MARKRHFVRRNRVMMVLTLLFAVYIGGTLVRQEFKFRELTEEKRQLEAQTRLVSEEVSVLQADLDASRSLEYSEKIAREKLKMVRPDEIVYILRGEEPASP